MKIGELAEISGFSTKTLRFYESIGLMPAPNREPNGYRSYQEDSLRRLAFISNAQSAGLSLKEIGEILAIRSSGVTPCEHVHQLLLAHRESIEAKIAELEDLQSELASLISYAESFSPESCDDGQVCSILSRKPNSVKFAKFQH